MLQQARRIGDLSTRNASDFRDLATLQCHSYLASINSLSLVEVDQAWVTIPLTDEEISVRPLSPSLPFSRLTNWSE